MSIAILDFGGQYTHLLAQRIRKLNVYSVIVSPQLSTPEAANYKGLILSGGPHSVNSSTAPAYNDEIFDLGIPILGICYGHQLLCKHFGATIVQGHTTEYGPATLFGASGILKNDGVPTQQVWMSHSDTVTVLPDCLRTSATTAQCPIAAVEHINRNIYGVQFHPEVKHTPRGDTILNNFINVCACARDWSVKSYLSSLIQDLREKYAKKSVFMLVSGGVDSTVAFTLLNRALGTERVVGLHIDNGFMRHQESQQVTAAFKELQISNLHVVDASQTFYSALSDVVDPQEKRRIIGDLFIDVQQRGLQRLGLGSEWLLGQGTIYPDTIESGGTSNSQVIKTHHNRVDRIQELIAQGLVVEPLADLYKDEVRELGELLGLPRELVWRHPFPGPGLAIRILCNDQLYPHSEALYNIQQEVNALVARHYLSSVVLPIKSVGVQGDARTFAHPVVLIGEASWKTLSKLSTLITNTIPQINRVLYYVTSAGGHESVSGLTVVGLTPERVHLLQRIDYTVTQFLREHELYDQVWQCPVVLIPWAPVAGTQSIVLRPVDSTEAMTANFSQLPRKLVNDLAMSLLSSEITSVLYDVTNKPPGTIEWE